ncbi:MAG: VIT family protein [Bdellovibrionales bacterium]|nr:VIT family protein [Bdellovibrionales bacterium]
MHHAERHRVSHIAWLRAAVLGANDGIISTASLVVGVASSGADRAQILTAGIAGLVAGAMSMAAGEYVSVSSQKDTEAADLERERKELITQPEQELAELAAIYVDRGLDRTLAKQVALQLTAKDALGAHARDELGILELMRARPLQAALASAATFTLGAGLPLGACVFTPHAETTVLVILFSILCLAGLGSASAYIGRASAIKSIARVTFWGALAMFVSMGVGKLFGVLVG